MYKIRSSKILLSLIKDLVKYKKYLNDDIENNYNVCKEISNNLINKTKQVYHVEGKNNIPPSENILVISNHESFFDIFVLLNFIDRPMSFVAAKELMKYPLVKTYINSIDSILIDRYIRELSVIKKQISDMENAIGNRSLILFPEGECKYNKEELLEFKKGGFVGTEKKDIRIVPTYINYKSICKTGKWVIPTDSVDVIFGESFSPKEVFEKKVNPSIIAKYSRNKVLELKYSLNNDKIS